MMIWIDLGILITLIFIANVLHRVWTILDAERSENMRLSKVGIAPGDLVHFKAEAEDLVQKPFTAASAASSKIARSHEMVTIIWGQGLSEDGRETFDSVEQARSMLEHDTDMKPEELDKLFETGKSTDDGGFWIVVE